MFSRIRLLLSPLLVFVLVAPLGAASAEPAVAEKVSATVEIHHSGAWQDITDRVYVRDRIKVKRGVQNEANRASPGRLTLTLNNRDGRFSPRNPRSPLFGLIGRNTPIRVSAGLEGGSQTIRFVGEVVQWPSRWDLSEQDVHVPLAAAGILRRLGTPGKPLRSALARHLEGLTAPVEWWPLGSRRSLIGSNDLRVTFESFAIGELRPQFGEGELFSHLPPGMRTASSRNEDAAGSLRGNIRPMSDGGFTVDFIYRTIRETVDPGDQSFDLTLDFDVPIGGGEQSRWEVGLSSGGDLVSVIGPDTGANPPPQFHSAPQVYNGDPHIVRLAVFDGSGTDGDYELFVDGESVGTGSFDSGFSTPPPPTDLHVRWLAVVGTDRVLPIELGHIMIWDSASTPGASDLATAALGHAGETAGRRAERLCSEQGVTFRGVGDLDSGTPMGPQRPRQFLNLLDECADAEAAGSRAPILTETRDEAGLTFTARESLYLTDAS